MTRKLLGYDSVPFDVKITQRLPGPAADLSHLGYDVRPDFLPKLEKEEPAMRPRAKDDVDMPDEKIAGILDWLRSKGFSEDEVAVVESMLNGSEPVPAPGALRSARDVDRAEAEVRGVLGADECLAFDSGAGIRRAALRRLGVVTAGIPDAALGAVLKGAKEGRRAGGRPAAAVAMDSAAERALNERFPHLARAGLAR